VKDLTPRQREILQVVAKYEHDTGEPCRFVYVSRRLAIPEPVVRHHFEALHRKGWVERPTSPVSLRPHRRPKN
jgi:Mn-dependent DtxR family transcriptional regulator